MPLNTITKSTTYLVTLAEVKANRSYVGTAHDDRLTALIAECSASLEKMADRTLTTTTYEMTLPGFFTSRIWFQAPPFNSVTFIKYYDSNNVLQTLDSGEYVAVGSTWGAGRVEPLDCWPSTYRRPDAVTIRYVAGPQSGNEKAFKRALHSWVSYHDFDRDMQQQNFAAVQRAVDSIRHEAYAC